MLRLLQRGKPLLPPLGPDGVLSCCTSRTSRSFSPTNKHPMPRPAASSARLNHFSDHFAAQRPLFLFGGQVKKRQQLAFETTHPALILPSRVSLFPVQVPLTPFVGVVSRSLPIRATTPAKTLLLFLTVVSAFSRPVLGCAPAHEHESMWKPSRGFLFHPMLRRSKSVVSCPACGEMGHGGAPRDTPVCHGSPSPLL